MSSQADVRRHTTGGARTKMRIFYVCDKFRRGPQSDTEVYGCLRTRVQAADSQEAVHDWWSNHEARRVSCERARDSVTIVTDDDDNDRRRVRGVTRACRRWRAKKLMNRSARRSLTSRHPVPFWLMRYAKMHYTCRATVDARRRRLSPK